MICASFHMKCAFLLLYSYCYCFADHKSLEAIALSRKRLFVKEV
jgi:hypothetical protein